MKKALKVNLSGQIFHIDEDAYDKLKNYLDAISSHFSNDQESKEIITDIESRIAELFSEKLKDGSQVVTIRLVEEIIEIMGKPEEIVSDEEPDEERSSRSRSQRRLYRDPESAVIGGVCSGLGAYFNIDTAVIRIIFVVFAIMGVGFSIPLYLILWIAVPKARTAAEKLEMRGEKVNVSNIEKTVREEYESVKENLRKAKESETYRRTESFFEEFFRVLGAIIVGFFKVILVIIGLAFVAVGLSLLIGFVALLFFGVHFLPFEAYHSMKFDYLAPFISPGNFSLLATSVTLLIAIPVLSLVYALFKAIFRFKGKDRTLGLTAFALWVLALIAAISMLVFEAREFSGNEVLSNTIELTELGTDKLVITMDKAPDDLLRRKESFEVNDNQYFFQKGGKIYGKVKVDIKKSGSGNVEIEVEKGAKGIDDSAASRIAESTIYNYSLDGNTLLLSPYFIIPSGEKWRMQYVDITVHVPEGFTISLEKTLMKHLEGVYNTEGYSGTRMAGKEWIMGERGLKLADDE